MVCPPGFDHTAANFDRYRPLPAGVPETIRSAVWATIGARPGARLLDLGAGSLRLGRAFIAAGDAYTGVDLSAGMLSHFIRQTPPASQLVQANGESLPFAATSFDVVFLAHVLSGLPAWQKVLTEARRVLAREGALILGQTVAPPAGLDAQLRTRLASILAGLGVDHYGPGKGREKAQAWLAPVAARYDHGVAARWDLSRTPRDFLTRQPTGARFAALPLAIRQAALQQLSAWAEATFGSLDTVYTESYTFELDVFRFRDKHRRTEL